MSGTFPQADPKPPAILDQARDLAASTLNAMDGRNHEFFPWGESWRKVYAADRERVVSDLRAIERAEAGLRDCADTRRAYADHRADHARRYTEARDDAWTSLKRTARLYGVLA